MTTDPGEEQRPGAGATPRPPLRAVAVFMVVCSLLYWAVLLGGPFIAHLLKGH